MLQSDLTVPCLQWLLCVALCFPRFMETPDQYFRKWSQQRMSFSLYVASFPERGFLSCSFDAFSIIFCTFDKFEEDYIPSVGKQICIRSVCLFYFFHVPCFISCLKEKKVYFWCSVCLQCPTLFAMILMIKA